MQNFQSKTKSGDNQWSMHYSRTRKGHASIIQNWEGRIRKWKWWDWARRGERRWYVTCHNWAFLIWSSLSFKQCQRAVVSCSFNLHSNDTAFWWWCCVDRNNSSEDAQLTKLNAGDAGEHQNGGIHGVMVSWCAAHRGKHITKIPGCCDVFFSQVSRNSFNKNQSSPPNNGFESFIVFQLHSSSFDYMQS